MDEDPSNDSDIVELDNQGNKVKKMKVSDDDVLEINSTRIVDIKRLDKFDKAKLKVESCRSNYIHGDARNFWKFEFLNKIVTNSQKTNLIVPAIMRWNCV